MAETRLAQRPASSWRWVAILGLFGLTTVVWISWPRWAPTTEAEPTGDRETAPPTVRATTVARCDLPFLAEATGRLEARRQVSLSAETAGTVVWRGIQDGQRVAADDVLARLDQRELEIDLREAEAELLRVRANYAVFVDPSQAEKRQSVADDSLHVTLGAELDRLRRLHAEGLVSDEELLRTERRHDAAALLTGQRQDEVRAVTIGLAQAEQAVARARMALDRTELRAPFGGRVADVAFEVGQRLSVGDPVLDLLDDSRLEADVEVLEADMVRLRLGAPAEVRVPALGDRRFEGAVTAINPRIDPDTGTGRVTIGVPNASGSLLPGVFVFVRLEVARASGRVTIPERSLLERQGRSLVFRLVDGTAGATVAHWTWVEVGRRTDGWVEIVDGLAVGDRVVVDGHFALAHETVVQVATSDPDGELVAACPADGEPA